MKSETYKEHCEKAIKRKLTKDEPVMRSCWNCNGSHEHLKKTKYLIYCLSCAGSYYRGKQLK